MTGRSTFRGLMGGAACARESEKCMQNPDGEAVLLRLELLLVVVAGRVKVIGHLGGGRETKSWLGGAQPLF